MDIYVSVGSLRWPKRENTLAGKLQQNGYVERYYRTVRQSRPKNHLRRHARLETEMTA